MKMLDRSRLKIEPFGTPESTLSRSLKSYLIYTTEIYLCGIFSFNRIFTFANRDS